MAASRNNISLLSPPPSATTSEAATAQATSATIITTDTYSATGQEDNSHIAANAVSMTEMITQTAVIDQQLTIPTTVATSSQKKATSASLSLSSSIKTIHELLNMPNHMELSQIDLIYRAEGNANLVLALPQFRKVLRLPKMLTTTMDNNMVQQQQQLQREHEANTSEQVLNQNKQVFPDLTMENFATYIHTMQQLLGKEFIFEVDIVRIPRDEDRQWINEHIRAARPAQRLDKEFCGQFGLLLPDATQLPLTPLFLLQSQALVPAEAATTTTSGEAAFSMLLSNLQQQHQQQHAHDGEITTLGDTYAIEIKPKQGWLLQSDVNDLFDTKPPTAKTTILKIQQQQQDIMSVTQMPTSTTATTIVDTTRTAEIAAANEAKVIKTSTRCRYCAMQFLKLQQRKITEMSSYCPIELFSGTPSRMLDALQSLFECPQNNFRIFRNGLLIYGDHKESLSLEELFENDLQSMGIELLKHLLVTCLLRDYTCSSSNDADDYCKTTTSAAVVVDECQRRRRRMAANVVVAPADDGDDDGAAITASVATDGQPCSSATSPKCQHKRISRISKATTTITETDTKATLATAWTTNTRTSPQTQINDVEMLCLPKNCVMQKILHLQLLAKHNFQHMYEAGYSKNTKKSYNILAELLKKSTTVQQFNDLLPVEQYLLGATALDCSIMLAFQEISIEECTNINSPHLVHLPTLARTFVTKVTLLDLDPKPDSHFHKYLQHTKKAYECCESIS